MRWRAKYKIREEFEFKHTSGEMMTDRSRGAAAATIEDPMLLLPLSSFSCLGHQGLLGRASETLEATPGLVPH